jgi:hypothetical protein
VLSPILTDFVLSALPLNGGADLGRIELALAPLVQVLVLVQVRGVLGAGAGHIVELKESRRFSHGEDGD